MLPTSNTLLAPVLVDLSRVHHDILQKRQKSKATYDQHSGAQHIEPEIGSYAYAKPPPRERGSPWIYSKVTAARDQNRSYTLQTPHSTIRRNRVHLRPAAAPTISSCQPIIRINHVHPASNPQAPYMAPHEPISSTVSSDSVEDPAETQPISICEDATTLPTSSDNADDRSKRAIRLPSKYSDFVMSTK